MVTCLSDPAPFAYYGANPPPARAVYSLDYTGTARLELNVSGFTYSYPVSAYGDVNNASQPIKLLSQKTSATVAGAGLMVATPYPYGRAAFAPDYGDNAPAQLFDWIIGSAGSANSSRLVLGSTGVSSSLFQFGAASPASAPITWNPTAVTTGAHTLNLGGSPLSWSNDPLTGFSVLGQQLWIGRSAVASASASVAAYTLTGPLTWTLVGATTAVMTGITKSFRLTGLVATSVPGSSNKVIYVSTTSASASSSDSRLMRVTVGATITAVSCCSPSIAATL